MFKLYFYSASNHLYDNWGDRRSLGDPSVLCCTRCIKARVHSLLCGTRYVFIFTSGPSSHSTLLTSLFIVCSLPPDDGAGLDPHNDRLHPDLWSVCSGGLCGCRNEWRDGGRGGVFGPPGCLTYAISYLQSQITGLQASFSACLLMLALPESITPPSFLLHVG